MEIEDNTWQKKQKSPKNAVIFAIFREPTSKIALDLLQSFYKK